MSVRKTTDCFGYPISKMGVAWYTPNSWRELQAVAEGPLASSYDEFVRRANVAAGEWKAKGIEVEKQLIDVAHMVAWCKRHGYRVDSRGRSAYGAALSLANGDTAELDKMPVEDRSRAGIQ